MNDQHISVAKEFTEYPFGRYKTEGDFSGETFRDDILLPRLRDGELVIVDLDGVLGGLGSSFLEEVFGGLIRHHGFTPESLRKTLKITSEADPSLAERAWAYVDRAAEGHR